LYTYWLGGLLGMNAEGKKQNNAAEKDDFEDFHIAVLLFIS
jgi:hypothetical protein